MHSISIQIISITNHSAIAITIHIRHINHLTSRQIGIILSKITGSQLLQFVLNMM
jgi:hypothetical protein